MELTPKLLKKNKVGLVILFGSKVLKTTHPGSDIDIGVVFENENLRVKSPVNVYGDLYQIFGKAFNTPVPDIVYLREAPLSLQYKAISEGKVLYCKSPKFLADYKEEVMIRYFDFQFVENYFSRVFLGQKL